MTKTHDELRRPEGNTLLDNYDLHDEGVETFLAEVPDEYDVFDIGLDKRNNTGEIIYDDAPDVRLEVDGETVAYVDIKTKSSEEWMGWFNERHYHKYREWADEHDAPVIIYMLNLDTGRDFFFHVNGSPFSRVQLSSREPSIRPFPDGNDAAFIRKSYRHDASWFRQYLQARQA